MAEDRRKREKQKWGWCGWREKSCRDGPPKKKNPTPMKKQPAPPIKSKTKQNERVWKEKFRNKSWRQKVVGQNLRRESVVIISFNRCYQRSSRWALTGAQTLFFWLWEVRMDKVPENRSVPSSAKPSSHNACEGQIPSLLLWDYISLKKSRSFV